MIKSGWIHLFHVISDQRFRAESEKMFASHSFLFLWLCQKMFLKLFKLKRQVCCSNQFFFSVKPEEEHKHRLSFSCFGPSWIRTLGTDGPVSGPDSCFYFFQKKLGVFCQLHVCLFRLECAKDMVCPHVPVQNQNFSCFNCFFCVSPDGDKKYKNKFWLRKKTDFCLYLKLILSHKLQKNKDVQVTLWLHS